MKGKLKKSVKRNEIVFSSNRSSLFESTKLRKKMGEEKKKKKRRGRKIGREKLDWRESNILLKSWNSKKKMGERRGGKTSFRTWLGYTHFTVSTMALHGDIVVEMLFPNVLPLLVNMFAVSVTAGPSRLPNRLACLARSCYWLTYSINSRGKQLLEMGSLVGRFYRSFKRLNGEEAPRSNNGGIKL